MADSKADNEPFVRPNLFSAYANNMLTYLKLRYPLAKDAELREFLRSTVTARVDRLKKNLADAQEREEDLSLIRPREEKLWPTVRVAKQCDKEGNFSYGNLEIYDDYDLLEHIGDTRSKIISPFGSAYETTNNTVSFLKIIIDRMKKGRKAEKKLQLEAAKGNNKTAETFHKNKQATIKITMNSLIGAMGSFFNFLSSKPNFNSVTSICRYFVMNAYIFTERFLEGNFYFRYVDQAINFVINCVNTGPKSEDVIRVIEKHGLYQPTADDVIQFLYKGLHRYNPKSLKAQGLEDLVYSLDRGHLAFIFYMNNLKNLVFYNELLFRPWIDKFFNDVENDDVTSVDFLNTVDGDLLIVLSVVANFMIPTNKTGNSLGIFDVVKQYPNIALKLAKFAKNMQDHMTEIDDIFDMFTHHRVSASDVIEHKHMFRDTVLSSDTDSVIFTTKTWVEWYTHELRMSPDAFNINALVVYWLSKGVSKMLYQVSTDIGCTGEDKKAMRFKNEFMMPVDILTAMKKNYVSLIGIQEGVVFGEPKLDIKGVAFKGSVLSGITLDYTNDLIERVLTDIYQNEYIDTNKYVYDVLCFERLVRDSLTNGDTEFLPIMPVKDASQYAKEEVSIYFNYQLWEAVFASKYGHIDIPNKCFVVPVSNMRNDDYLNHLKKIDMSMCTALVTFLSKTDKKSITRIPICPLIDKVPSELTVLVDFPSIVYKNIQPASRLLNSIGVETGGTEKDKILFSDVYGWVSSEEGQELRKRLDEIRSNK